MKIQLIQPPVRDFYQTGIRTQPIGLAYLAGTLKKHHHEIEIFDCGPPGEKTKLPIPDELSYMKQYYTDHDLSPFRLYGQYYHFGLSWQTIKEHIDRNAPQAVGISCQFTPYFSETLKVASIAKSCNPHVPVIVGGSHASSLPREVLKSPYVDYVVLGEAEETLPQLIQSIESGEPPWHLDGVGFKHDGTIHVNSKKTFIDNLDSMPFPDRSLLNLSYYKINNEPYTMLLTSRGCPRNCSFCSVAAVMGKRFRMRSPENILQEIKLCKETYGISLFDIEDDNFTFDNERALSILSLIVDEFGENEIKLFAMNGLSIISLNRDILKKMKQAGFQYLDLSLGSSSAEINRQMNRPADKGKTEQVLKQANEIGFSVTTYIILGIPGHCLEEMMDSIVYLMARETFLGPSIFYPSPGSRIFDDLAGQPSFNPDYTLLRSSAFPVETEQVSRLDIVTLLRIARWINYIKGLLDSMGIREISLENLRKKAFTEWWPEAVPKIEADSPGDLYYFSLLHPLQRDHAGQILTAFFLNRKSFYGVVRLKDPQKKFYNYQIFPYKTSSTVVDLFWRSAKSNDIRSAIMKKK